MKLQYCRPLPSRPPSPALNSGNSRPHAPPSRATTRPVRANTVRMPASCAGAAASSHSSTASAGSPSPGRRALVHGAVPGVAVVADRAAARPAPAAVRRGRRRPRRSAAVPSTRLSRISFLYASVQRRSPTPAPGEVDDGVAARPARPRRRTAARGSHSHLVRRPAAGRAHQAHHLVPVRAQRAHECRADEPGGTGDRDPHGPSHPAPRADAGTWHSDAHVRVAHTPRTARTDEAALGELDRRHLVAAARRAAAARAAVRPLLRRERTGPSDFLVAELDDRRHVVGYIRLVPPTPLACNAHVRQIQGLAVADRARGRGVGAGAAAGGVRRGAAAGRGPDDAAGARAQHAGPRLYESEGFAVEGVLPGEFCLDGRYVDDVLMGRSLTP